MAKGLGSFISAVLLVVVALAIAVMVSSWLTAMSEERATKLKNFTQEKLNCQYASLYIRNVTYDCNNNCFTGSPYKINATIENTGTVRIDLSKIVTQLDTGQVYTSPGPGYRISAGDIETADFNAILIYSDPALPI